MKIKIKSIKINIDYSFILLIILFLYISLYKLIFTVLISLLIHELFHIITYLYYKKKKNERINITLNISIFGGIGSFDYQSFSKFEMLIFFLSGIFGNFILLIISKIIIFDLANEFMKYNLLLIIFNLLPIYPLDGYNIIKVVCGKVEIIRYLALIFLFLISLYTKAFSIMIIFIFLLIKNIKIKEDITKDKLNNIMKNLKESNYNIDKLLKI